MILINLLPHREAARKQRKEAFNATMLMSLLGGVLVSVLIYLWYQYQLEKQQSRNDYLKSEIGVLDTQIKEITGLEGEIASLRARQKAVEDLQANRNLPVHLFAELVQQIPEGVYLSQLRQVEQVVEMKGVAQSNERVSEMLRNISNNTPWFSKPDLQEIVASTLALTQRDQRKVVNFNLRFNLVKPADAVKGPEALVVKKAGV